MSDIMGAFAQQFGLPALYAVIILYMGFIANNIKHLFFMLGIACGVYITMFKAFNLKVQLGFLDLTKYTPVGEELGNMVMAVLFVYIIGFAAYSLRRVVTSVSSSR